MSWQALEKGNRVLADFGAKRLARNHVGYLATIRKDGSPRVHPMTPFVGEGHLFFFTEVGALFWQDLHRDARYALHCSVETQYGGNGEFSIRGRVTHIEDADQRKIAEIYVPYTGHEDYALFELNVEHAFGRIYAQDGDGGMVERWKP